MPTRRIYYFAIILTLSVLAGCALATYNLQ